jgi:hypothetical protein
MLGGVSRIYGTHHVNSSPCDSQLIAKFNNYIWALWTSPDITDQILKSYCYCLTWRTHGLPPGSGKLIEKEKNVLLHLNLGTLSFICHLSVLSDIAAVHLVSVKVSGTELSSRGKCWQTYWRSICPGRHSPYTRVIALAASLTCWSLGARNKVFRTRKRFPQLS